MTDGIVATSPDQVMDAIVQMASLPWPESDEWLDWTIDGLEGQTSYLLHVLPLAATSDSTALAAFTSRLAGLADRRWGARHRFDATRFTDDARTEPAAYDRRSAPASMVRSLGAEAALWWRFGEDAVMLVDTSAAGAETSTAALLVLSAQWLDGPGAEEEALQQPLVADFLSQDGRRVLHAAWEVFRTREPAVLQPLVTALPAIERATADLDLGGMLASNGKHLDHALGRIRIFGERRCLCAAYPEHVFYEPAKEEAYGHIRIVEVIPTSFHGRPGRPERICECLTCGQRFDVEEGEYHYPWWQWRARKPAP